MLIGAAPHAFAACQSPAAFGGWLQGFKKSAVAQGISPGVVSEALDGLTYDPATIAKDRSQGVFAQSFLQFSGRMVSGNRLSVGSSLLKKNASTFAAIQQKYGVPGPVLVGFWGLETDFGKVMRWPSSVSWACGRSRRNRSPPSSPSSWRMARVSEGWATWHSSAARVKLRARATARK